ncbi:MAG TPA: FIST N-terminal domain-containing protein [Chitinophagaceae bacterium]|nr:FIST N-terminal domain-containing protein [Chitinophagaceae bacterium]
MKAKSIKGKSPEEIKTALQQSLADGYKPTLAFVFISIKQDRDTICGILDVEGIRVFGATTGGEFIDGDIGSGSIAILLLDINPLHFKILLENIDNKDPATIARSMTQIAVEQFKNPAFILSYGVKVETGLEIGESVVRGIEDVAGSNVSIWGGVAGDDFVFKKSLVFTNQKTYNQAILMLVLDADKITVKGQAASGWKAVGTEKTMTKTVDNWLHTIDGQPAADMVLKYMGLSLTKEQAETFNPGITVFSIQRDEGEPVMRSSGVFNWEDRSIAITGNIKEGDRMRLTLPPDFEMIETVSNDAEHIRQTEMPDADALIMFSCIGRLHEFGPMISDEINGVKKAFDVPMAGFFSYGEFGRATNGNNEFHNLTCCWVALKEKESGY